MTTPPPGREPWAGKPRRATFSLKGNYICTTGRRYQGCLMIRDAEKLALETGNPRAISTVRLARALAERWLGLPGKAVELTEGVVEEMLSTFYFEAASLHHLRPRTGPGGNWQNRRGHGNRPVWHSDLRIARGHGPFGPSLQHSGLLLHGDSTDRESAGTEFPEPGTRSRTHGKIPFRTPDFRGSRCPCHGESDGEPLRPGGLGRSLGTDEIF